MSRSYIPPDPYDPIDVARQRQRRIEKIRDQLNWRDKIKRHVPWDPYDSFSKKYHRIYTREEELREKLHEMELKIELLELTK
tara:strand:- start:293 stop:538 length:246 start_codon:yes stop_codon:yes gene_type:complete